MEKRKIQVVYFSVAVEPEYGETAESVIRACERDLKHGQCGLWYSHTAWEEESPEEDFDE